MLPSSLLFGCLKGVRPVVALCRAVGGPPSSRLPPGSFQAGTRYPTSISPRGGRDEDGPSHGFVLPERACRPPLSEIQLA